MNDFGLVGVLMGGCSSEREISLKSGHGVAAALEKAGHKVVAIDIKSDDKRHIIAQLKGAGIDVAFIALHGRLGEDGFIQSICEEIDLPYTGSGVKASQSAYNKTICQQQLKSAGLPVPEFYIISDGHMADFKTVWGQIKSTPVVVKAACEGSSIGVHMVRHPSEWQPAMKNALSFGPYVIIEQFLKGREFTAGIFDRTPLPIVEIIPKTSFFDFNSKYQKGMTQYIVPAVIDEALAAKIGKIALAAHDALGCEGFSRVDIRLNAAGQPFILEVNTIPGFTETSLFPKAAAVAGTSFVEVCEHLIKLAYGKKTKH